MTQVNSIVFAQAQDNKKAVVANKYVAHTLYEQNKAIIEKLGGEIVKGVGGFRAEFKTVANAKKFITQAITEVSKREYNAARKSEPKETKRQPKEVKKPQTQAKGNKGVEVVTLTDEEGNKYTVPKSALTQAQAKETKKGGRKGKGNNAVAPTKAKTEVKETKKPARKSKGNAELTDAGKKALEKMKTSVLNRAASAYSIANGGETTTFSALGKSAKALSAYIPNAKAGLLKSPKWKEASEKYGLTEEMLG